MKFFLLIPKPWCKIMKITLGQVIFAVIFSGLSYAKPGKAQVMLERPVTIDLNNTPLSNALKQIEKSADVKFIYSKSLIPTDQDVSLNARHEKLVNVLARLLNPYGIAFEVVNERIVLNKEKLTENRPLQPITPVQPIQPIAPLGGNKQVFVVTGRVTAATGEALPGVSVRVKNSSTGSTTDVDGKYSLTLPDVNATLVFDYIGYASQEVAINGRAQVNVILAESNKSLNEVVVIGYQSVRKKDLTGAVSVINSVDAAKVTSNSLAESLQGLSPGVTVRSSGAPGANSEIEIRGIGSLYTSAPLYVIDGMIADANVTVNNNDIASIQILKDASAAAIYGSRAGNGVIIITTKKGREGAPKLSFSAKYGQQHVPKKWDVMNSAQYAATKKQQFVNSGQAVPAGLSTNFDPSINTDWQDLDERTGNDMDYNISLSGGSSSSTYLISASYYDNKGVLLSNSFNRASFRINTETKKGILTAGENILLTNSNNYHPNRGAPFYDLPTSLPTVPVKNSVYINNSTSYPDIRSSNNPFGYSTGIDPYDYTNGISGGLQNYSTNMIAANQLSQGYNNYGKIVGNAFAQLKLTDWLDYKFNIGFEASFDYNRDIRQDGILTYAQQQELSYVDEDRERFTNFLMEHTLNFNKTFGVHEINGVIGFTQQYEHRLFTDARRTGLQIVDGQYLTSIASASGTPAVNGGTGDDHKIISYLGRVNYTYNDRYLLTLTGRIDQDSEFGPNYRTGYFPSIAGAWRISKENFFKADWVNDLKINASYGVLGINTITAFQNQGYINNAPRAVFSSGVNTGNDVIQNGAYQAGLYNPDVRWESRYETNIGVDATILNSKLSISASVYRSISKNALITEILPSYLGANNRPSINAGSISNKGIEFEATYRNNDHNFKWSLSGNFTTIKNRVLNVGNQAGADYILQGSDIARFQVGHPIGSWFVLKDIGIFQSQAEINNYKRSNGDLIEPFAKPGDVKFYANPDGTGQVNNNDRVFNGSSLPNLQTGLQFSGNYKQFSVNLQLVGVFGNKIFDDPRTRLDSYQNNNFRSDVSPWTPTNTNTSDPRLALADGDPGIVSNNTYNSSRWLENGSYARIRNLEFGYQLPKSLLSKWHVDNARVFISGQNLLTVTKYKGLDPDLPGASLLQPGLDNGTWPSSRVYSVGINCGF